LVVLVASDARFRQRRLRTRLVDLATRWRQQVWTRLQVGRASVVAVLDLKTKGDVNNYYSQLFLG
jgi:hypothetical protein